VAEKEKLPYREVLLKKISVAPLFCFIPVYFSVAAERNSELSVSAGVGVVLWLLFSLLLVSLLSISRCLNVLGWARIISFAA